MADSVDMLNFVRLFFADFLLPEGIDLRRPDEVLRPQPESYTVTGCKSLYDALEKNESLERDFQKNGHQLRSQPLNNRWKPQGSKPNGLIQTDSWLTY